MQVQLDRQRIKVSELLLREKTEYEEFTRRSIQSETFATLVRNNRGYRHIARFALNLTMFIMLLFGLKLAIDTSRVAGACLYPLYIYVQGLVIAGFMVHSHELSHNQIKNRWINDAIGIVSGLFSLVNFYSFQYAHRLHHRNIGNLDTPEAGAPVSVTGQRALRCDDRARKLSEAIAGRSAELWILLSWPIFVYYGDYCSWLLPFRARGRTERRSIAVFAAFLLMNGLMIATCPVGYLGLYLVPALLGGNRILAITYLHHAHEGSVFFSTEHHNQLHVIMSNTDRDYGRIVNFFMMNNGYHIPHHMNPQIAYYDLKRASRYLRSTLPSRLRYNFLDNRNLYRDLTYGLYEQRLDRDHEVFELKLNSEVTTSRLIGL